MQGPSSTLDKQFTQFMVTFFVSSILTLIKAAHHKIDSHHKPNPDEGYKDKKENEIMQNCYAVEFHWFGLSWQTVSWLEI